MASLYLDPIVSKKPKSIDETTVKVLDETLIQEGSENFKNTTDVTLATDDGDIQKIDDVTDVGNMVDNASQSLKEKDPESDAGKNVGTSGTHEDVIEDFAPTTSVDNTVSNALKETTDVVTKGNTHPDESEDPKHSNEKENDSADKAVDDNTVVVDIDKYVPESPIKEATSGSTAKRLRRRSGKASVSTNAPRKEEKSSKKTGLNPQLYGPKKSSSNGIVSSEKKKNLKRKAPPSSDSE
ncbi:hypothetical protein A2U01_0032843, partial [Trifolium medium]|nr:hypothetical protein [Trifolium medium]